MSEENKPHVGLVLVSLEDVSDGYTFQPDAVGLYAQFEALITLGQIDHSSDLTFNATVRVPMTVSWEYCKAEWPSLVLAELWADYVIRYFKRNGPILGHKKPPLRMHSSVYPYWSAVTWVHEDGTPYDTKPLERKRMLKVLAARS